MQRDIVRLRQWCIRRYKQDWPVAKICGHAQIPKRTFYNWLGKYRKHHTLEDMSRMPHSIRRTPVSIANEIITIRKTTNRNEYAIASYLKRKGINISHSTVYNVLSRNNLVNHLSKPRKQRTYIRFSRMHSNSLWQTDLTIFGNKHLIAFLDDHSRFITGIDFLSQSNLENILSIFQQAIDEYGKPKQIMTDHGTQFYSVRKGESLFEQYCIDNKIQHILGGIGKPTTQGKIERFFQTLKQEYARFNDLRKYVKYYNYQRLHGGIEYLTPAEVYLVK